MVKIQGIIAECMGETDSKKAVASGWIDGSFKLSQRLFEA